MKRTGKILALLLTAALLLSVLPVSAFAQDDVNVCPIVFIHGFMSAHLVADKDAEGADEIWPPATDAILAAVKENISDISKSLLLRDWPAFGQAVSKAANKILTPLVLGDDGTPLDNSGVYFRYPDPELIAPESELRFTYDWRLDPIEVAAQLNDFINYVCEAAGVPQVNLCAHSLGNVVMLSYFTLYGFEKVRGVCFNAAALYGATYDGELMRGDMIFDSTSLENYLRFLLGDNDYRTLLDGLLTIAKDAGILKLVEKLGNSLLEKEQEILSREVLLPLFGNWLSIWSMVPDDAIDEAMRYVFDELYAGEDHSALREKMEAYNTLVRGKREETLLALNEHANVYVFSRYGSPSFPLTSSFLNLGDGVIDTKYSSFGATTAPYGQQLPASYRETVPAGYLSPDGAVDASTCLFPEQTWFIRDMQHFNTPDNVEVTFKRLLNYDGQATVNTFDDIPRFLLYDVATESLVPDPGVTETTALDRLRSGWNEILLLMKNLLKKIFPNMK